MKTVVTFAGPGGPVDVAADMENVGDAYEMAGWWGDHPGASFQEWEQELWSRIQANPRKFIDLAIAEAEA